MVHRVQRVTMSSTKSDNDWQRMTTNDSEWYNEWQRVTTNDNEWQRMKTSGTTSGLTNESEWEWFRFQV